MAYGQPVFNSNSSFGGPELGTSQPQTLCDPDEDMPMGTRRNRAGSRRMMDGNENLLENEASRIEHPNTSILNNMMAARQLAGVDE